MKRRTNIYLDDEDHAAIALIRAHYGLDSDASAIRFILRKEAKEIEREERKDKSRNK